MMFDFMHRLSDFSLHTEIPYFGKKPLQTKMYGQEYNESLSKSTYNNSLNDNFEELKPFFSVKYLIISLIIFNYLNFWRKIEKYG